MRTIGKLLVLVMLGCLGCDPQEARDGIRFGAIVSSNGVASSYGRENERGLRVAQAYLNDKGGINGDSVRIDIKDSNSDPDQAVTLAKQFANDSATIGLLGPTRTNEAVAVSRALPQLLIPTISVGSTGPWMAAAKADFDPYFFRSTRVDTEEMIRKLLEVARDSFHVRTIALLSLTDDDWSKWSTATYRTVAPQLGLSIIGDESGSAKDEDWSVQLTKMRGKAPDAIVVNILADKAPTISRQARTLGIASRFIGTAAFSNPATWANAGPNGLDGILIAENFYAGSTRPIVREFVQRYNKMYQSDPSPYAAYAFDGAILLAEATRRAGPHATRAAVRDSLASLKNFEAVLGSITYRGSGDAEKGGVVLQFRDGGYHEVIAWQPRF